MAQFDTVTKPVAAPDTANPAPIAPSTPPTAVAPPSARAAKLRADFAAAAQARGLPYLGWNDPTALLLWQLNYNLTPDQAQAAAYAVARHNQERPDGPYSDAELDAIGFGVRAGQAPGQIGYGANAATEQSAAPTYAPTPGVGQAIQDWVTTASQTQNFTDANGNIDPAAEPQLLGGIIQTAQAHGVTLSPAQARQIAVAGIQYGRAFHRPMGQSDLDQLVGTTAQYGVPNPNKVNPAVWDSLGPIGQGLATSAAKGQGWDPDEYQRQINAQRPVGTAPRQSRVDYSGLGTGVT